LSDAIFASERLSVDMENEIDNDDDNDNDNDGNYDHHQCSYIGIALSSL